MFSQTPAKTLVTLEASIEENAKQELRLPLRERDWWSSYTSSPRVQGRMREGLHQLTANSLPTIRVWFVADEQRLTVSPLRCLSARQTSLQNQKKTAQNRDFY